LVICKSLYYDAQSENIKLYPAVAFMLIYVIKCCISDLYKRKEF